uniref:N-acetylgalactosaminide beta-1,3-galactosyltransferase n=1 Tax=Panagrolaimus sp. JU765 TaxID=591449 RepID=A0AC34R7L2_9BILA
MKADDDSYVFMDNLYAYLNQLDPTKPYYLGYRWKGFIDHGYNSGGVYILSKAAVMLFIEKLMMNDTTCAYNQYEDLGIGACLNHIGIYPHNTTDSQGKERFLVYDPIRVYHGGLADNDINLKGFDAFSAETISFHHMDPSNLIFTHIIRRFIKYPLQLSIPVSQTNQMPVNPPMSGSAPISVPVQNPGPVPVLRNDPIAMPSPMLQPQPSVMQVPLPVPASMPKPVHVPVPMPNSGQMSVQVPAAVFMPAPLQRTDQVAISAPIYQPMAQANQVPVNSAVSIPQAAAISVPVQNSVPKTNQIFMPAPIPVLMPGPGSLSAAQAQAMPILRSLQNQVPVPSHYNFGKN